MTNNKMSDLLQGIESLTQEEYDRAASKFGIVNHSNHESYAVLLEEIEEAKAEMDCVDIAMKQFWIDVKNNAVGDATKRNVEMLMTAAMRLAAESVQIAAMAVKAIRTIEGQR